MCCLKNKAYAVSNKGKHLQKIRLKIDWKYVTKTSLQTLIKKDGVKALLNEKTLPLFKIKIHKKYVKKTSVKTLLKKDGVKTCFMNKIYH